MIALDFDGTIADTMPALTRLARYVGEACLAVHPDDMERWYFATAGRSFPAQLEALGFHEEPDAIECFQRMKRSITMRSPYFPDVPRVLDRHRFAIASSTDQDLIREWLHARQLDIPILSGDTKAEQVSNAAAFIGDTDYDEQLALDLEIPFRAVCHDKRLYTGKLATPSLSQTLETWFA